MAKRERRIPSIEEVSSPYAQSDITLLEAALTRKSLSPLEKLLLFLAIVGLKPTTRVRRKKEASAIKTASGKRKRLFPKTSVEQKIERASWSLGKGTISFLQAATIGAVIKTLLKEKPGLKPLTPKWWLKQGIPYALITGAGLGALKGYGEKYFSQMYRPLVSRYYYRKYKRRK